MSENTCAGNCTHAAVSADSVLSTLSGTKDPEGCRTPTHHPQHTMPLEPDVGIQCVTERLLLDFPEAHCKAIVSPLRRDTGCSASPRPAPFTPHVFHFLGGVSPGVSAVHPGAHSPTRAVPSLTLRCCPPPPSQGRGCWGSGVRGRGQGWETKGPGVNSDPGSQMRQVPTVPPPPPQAPNTRIQHSLGANIFSQPIT